MSVITSPHPELERAESYANLATGFQNSFATLSASEIDQFVSEFGLEPNSGPRWRNPHTTALEIVLRLVVADDLDFDVPGHPVEATDELASELFANVIDAAIADLDPAANLSSYDRQTIVEALTFG